MHRGKRFYCCALHKNYYNYFAELDSENGIGYNIATKFFGGAVYVNNTRIVNAEIKQGHYCLQRQARGLDGLRRSKDMFP